MRVHFMIGLSLFVLPSSAFADETEQPPDPKVLYDDAVAAMDAGDYEKACPMIERVTQMLPDGLGAKFTLAECHEEHGKLANAYATFVLVEKAAREQGQEERSQRASARADALRPKLGQIKFTGPQSLASGYDLRVEIDGVAIESAQLEQPRYVDPGMHQVVAFAKGVRRSGSTIDIDAGAVHEMPIRELLNLPTRDSQSDSSAPIETAESSSPSAVPSWDLDPNASKPAEKRGFPVWQTVVGGIGLVAIGAGVGFKLDSVDAERKLVEQCGEDMLCPRNSYYHPDADNERKNRSFGLFLGMTSLGAMALGTAAVGMIRWHSAKQNPPKQTTKTSLIVQPTFSPAHGGVVFSGNF
ncbi:MAG: hypothetical protein IPM54_03330 [Polyangiaceae bacterium]|nr:hypothetical protein [Polyangiaceae bacterium]